MAQTIFDAWDLFVEEIPTGFPTASLRSDDLQGAGELLELDVLLDGIERITTSGAFDRRRFMSKPHLASIARRCLLGRFPHRIERFRPLWVDNDASEEVVDLAVEAAGLNNRPGQIITAREETADRFSPTHNDFVGILAKIERAPNAGPFGDAIRASRYAVGEGGVRTPLAGESRLPPGFPIVRLAVAQPKIGFRDFAWVEPATEWPRWLADDESVSPSEPRQASRRERLCHVRALLRTVEDSVRGVVGDHQRPRGRGEAPEVALPDWLTWYALNFDFEEFDSAGLALALQHLSDSQGRPIPAGVGFTGSWRDGRLQTVAGIRGKLRAAREAGIFVLFACADDDEVEGLQPEDRQGVTLALLERNSGLDEVVVRVNTVCHDLGLTEYRWRRVVEGWERRVLGHRDQADLSRLLPYAAERTCPVGFVGRDGLLSALEDRKQSRDSGHIALVGSPRSGKTTTLSQWVFRRPSVRHRRPVWFSFLRRKNGARSLADLETALIDQIRARYCVLGSRSAEGETSSLHALMRSMPAPTRPRIDLVVDGLDEADPGDQQAIADLLLGLPPGGIVVVGTQPVQAANVFTNRVTIGDAPPQEDAEALLDRFAARFKKRSESPRLREIGLLIRNDRWRSGMIKRSAGHFWILTEYLGWIEKQEGNGWPDSPDGLRLSPNVNEYCKLILEEIEGSADGGWDDLETFLIT